MIVGYARTSTADQMAGFDAQLQELKAVECKKMFQEQVSSVGGGQTCATGGGAGVPS
ncbi:recombinase family protein [Xylella fastidiosa subsp. sandyi]|jgi:DNA invertase Pin-like site-specific DNA recombinase|uniref:recombinase family protein n=1 Tax=Xylella fastidiosa TaxID=2371 RepID=UPI000E58712F|nr:recombinase family protein [Xylella fastidiosa]NBI38542.1 hypothetical protein [Xylella fastidiosa subsp. fastidiosa]QIS26123.1 hypothetical protein F7G16_07995 [Xylella fastidiosa]RUA36370.1 hypothetical protein DX878_08365 [Xylella fastidiosa subsp. fastidiosa]RUA37565.1 hypothetical protein DX877_05645 [Xylella fastidiosa subsp. fastidiosa]TWP32896.1 hypothetical protein FNS29_10895 [Xylella fastidiosa subsp. fastidiosa]